MGNVFNKKKSSEENIDEDDTDILHQEIYIPPLTDYKYFNRRMPYSSEKKEISESEQKKLSQIIQHFLNFLQKIQKLK